MADYEFGCDDGEGSCGIASGLGCGCDYSLCFGFCCGCNGADPCQGAIAFAWAGIGIFHQHHLVRLEQADCPVSARTGVARRIAAAGVALRVEISKIVCVAVLC